MRKKTANCIMVAVIVVITAVGILLAGQHLGWFDRNDDTQAIAFVNRDKGIVELTRNGIATHLDAATVLHDGDQLSGNSGAQATVEIGESRLILGENASLTVEHAAVDGFSVTVRSGEVFLCAKSTVSVVFGGQAVEVKDSTAVISVCSDSVSIGILAGEVNVGEKVLSGGQSASFAGNGLPACTALDAAALSDFFIHCTQDSGETLCFTNEELTKVLAERQAAGDNKQDSNPDKNNTSASLTCTVEIRCDTILSNMDSLTPGKDSYVPSNGVILNATVVSFTEGEAVFDVLKRACDQNSIPLEYSYTPVYESYYIEGINHLYEFDCGNESGWMYNVNGQFPNYGCSEYTLSQGDTIVWCYTCNGLGADVGGSGY